MTPFGKSLTPIEPIAPIISQQDRLAVGEEYFGAHTYAACGKQKAAYYSFLSVAGNPASQEECRAVAQYEVGIRLKEGRGIGRHYAQAFDWLSQSALQGNPLAHLELGKMLALGLGVPRNYAEAIRHFKAAVELGNAQAWCELGKLYVLGYGQDSDYKGKTHNEAAWECFTKAKELGVPEGECELGKLYLYGCGVKRDFKQALVHIQAAAEQEVPEALCMLGLMYDHGDGVVVDHTTAVAKYRAAADLGSGRALNILGNDYLKKKEYSAAFTCSRQAVERGNWRAVGQLGYMYEKGYGTKENKNMAVMYYRQAASAGDCHALYNLGLIYLDGRGVEQNYSAAIDFFRRAGELGVAEAWDELKAIHDQGKGYVGDYLAARTYYENLNMQEFYKRFGELDVKKTIHDQGKGYAGDYLAARTYYENLTKQALLDSRLMSYNEYGDNYSVIIRRYRAAAKKDDPRAIYNLGMFYLEGRGVDKNLTLALEFLERAAQLQDPQAKHQLAKLLKNDSNATPAEVVACYKAAAQDKYPWALVGLGKMYALGSGVTKNIPKAIELFKEAAEMKFPQAMCELGKLTVLGYGQEVDDDMTHYKEAMTYFKMAMEHGSLEARCELGKMVLFGYGVEKNFDWALHRIQAAANQGVADALYWLGVVHENGWGVVPNIKIAIEKYQAAAELGSSDALVVLGFKYKNGKDVPKNETAALNYDRFGVALGNPTGMNNLAKMYFEGIGIEKDLAAASMYQRQAAALGNVISLYNLGTYCYMGKSWEREFLAVDYYRRAAELGVKDAWDQLKTLSNSGHVNVRDYKDAREYYEDAHKKGLPRAGVVIFFCNEYGKNFSPILSYYKKAAQEDPKDARAIYNIGMLHLEGRGVAMDLIKAEEYLLEAEKMGDSEAKNRLDKLATLDDINLRPELLAAYIEAAQQKKTWALLRLGELYVNDLPWIEQDTWKGMGYLKELESLAGEPNLTDRDNAHIRKAAELLSNLEAPKDHVKKLEPPIVFEGNYGSDDL